MPCSARQSDWVLPEDVSEPECDILPFAQLQESV
jgi:hypothetical protein